MKKLILTFILSLAMAIPAMAFEGDVVDKAVWSNYSGNKSAARYSDVYKVSRYKNKQVIVHGQYSSGVFQNMSGTLAVEVSPDGSTRWVAAEDYAGTALTATTNNAISWADSAAYVRFKWTAVKRRVNLWFRMQGNN